MDKFNVFYPHLTALLFLLLFFAFFLLWLIVAALIVFKILNRNGVRFAYVWKMSSQTWEKIIFSTISIIASVFIIFFLVPWFFSGYLNSKPDENWQTKAMQANTAIIYGFGYGEDESGKMTAEASNQALYELARKQMNMKYLIMQEGVYIAAMNDSIFVRSGNIQLVRMHPLDLKKDVNTIDASKYALIQMEKLGQSKAVIYAHSLQVKRAVADLRKIASSYPKWKNFEFIIPDIPETPFPKHSAQWRTNNKIIYRAIELYYSRVRDAWCFKNKAL
jgi:hypothetical protein